MTNKSIRDYINLIENAQREGVAEGTETVTASSIVNFINSEINRYYKQDNDFAAQWLAELVHVLTDSRPGWRNLTYDEIMQHFIQYDIDRLLKDGSREARKIAKVYHNLKQQLVSKFGPKQGMAEGSNEPPVSYREMINSVQKQYTKWYSELVNHYAQLGNSSDEFKKKIVAAYNAYKNGQSVAHIPIVGPVKE